MLIEKKLNHTEITYGYIFWSAENDNQIKKILKNTEMIDAKIGEEILFSRNVDLNRRRIYLGSALKNLNCDKVRITITSKYVDIECIKR